MSQIFVGVSMPHKFKLGAESIKWWIGAPYSHAYIRFESSEIPSTVYHAAHGMVHFKAYDNFLIDNAVFEEFKIEMDNDKRIEILTECINIAGEPYDKTDLIYILASDIANKLGKKASNYDGPGYICSELVGKILIEKLGFIFAKPTHLLSPKDIFDAMEKYESSHS